MNRYKIELVTMADCSSFVNTVTKLEGKIILEDNSGFRINAKSLLGALAAMEWEELYCCSEKEIYSHIKQWVK